MCEGHRQPNIYMADLLGPASLSIGAFGTEDTLPKRYSWLANIALPVEGPSCDQNPVQREKFFTQNRWDSHGE
jgi:hypothetical protein